MWAASALRLSRSKLSMSPGLMATEAGAVVLWVERLVILVRWETSTLMDGLASTLSLLPTAATLQLKSEPQDWPARRRGKMKQFMILPRPLVVQRMGSSEQVASCSRVKQAQKVPFLMVVLRISMLASVMVPLVVSLMTKGIGR